MVYGFEINPSTNNLISCIGRTQPKGCYSIQIAFIDFGPKNESKPVIYQYGSGIIFISLIAFVGYGYLKGKKTNLVKKNNYIRLGSFILFKDQRLLKNDVAIIELSNKESKLLAVVA